MKILSISPEECRIDVFLKTVDTALMQVDERLSNQQFVTWAFNILFPNRQVRGRNDEISKESSNLLSLHSKILQ